MSITGVTAHIERVCESQSRRLGWGLNKSREKGVLNSSLDVFDPGRLFQAASDVCNKNEPLLSF